MPENVLLDSDAPPSSGKWVEACDLFPTLTREEALIGGQLGRLVSTGDDLANGMSLAGRPDLAAFPLPGVSAPFDDALAKARALRDVLLEHGVPEVSIEMQPGRPSTHGTWDALFIVSEFSHHTVSRLGSNLTPVLGLCKRGRSDLPGPLCNGYGGWDLCYRILTFGYANHPGAGGPMTVPAFSGGTFTIPRDSARRYAWGTEWEGGLDSGDWNETLRNPRTGHRMTMREFMGRSNAGLRAFHQIVHHAEHSTWTTRKIDRLGYSAAAGTAELLRYAQEEDTMREEDWTRLEGIVEAKVKEHAGAAVWGHRLWDKPRGEPNEAGQLLTETHNKTHRLITEDDEEGEPQ